MKRLLIAAPGFALLVLALLGSVATGVADTDFCLDSNNNSMCPDDIHVRHRKVMADCQGCHNLRNSFDVTATFYKDNTKPAFISGGPVPTYTASGKWSSTPTIDASTCSNIACHSTTPGTFGYYFPGGDGEPVWITVTTGGVSTAVASWQSNKETVCNSCHGDPPNDYVWHSGYHGGAIAGANNCELCHPDAKSTTLNGQIIYNSLTDTSLHQNGTVNVLARYTSQCFGCH